MISTSGTSLMDKGISFLKLIHGDQNRYINFGRKIIGQFQHIGSIKIGDLDKFWSKLKNLVALDGYFSVNDFHNSRPYSNKLSGLPEVNRVTRNVHNLNACFVDLDVGRKGSSDPIAAMPAMKAKDEICAASGIDFPHFSAMVFSGQGLYLFWFLEDDDGRPVHANYHTRRLYGKVQRALVERFQSFRADPQCIDVTRVLRIPGTLHSRSNKVARVLLKPNRRYTLESLATKLGIQKSSRKRLRRSPPGKVSRIKSQAGRKGFVALHRKRTADVLALEKLRGGFPKGMRRRVIWHYIQFLAGAGEPVKEAARKAQAMANRCRPTYDVGGPESVDDMVSNVYYNDGRYKFSTRRIVADLKIRSTESVAANLHSLIPSEVAEQRENERFKIRESHRTRKDRECELVRLALKKNPHSSCADIQKVCGRRGFPISRQTAYRRIAFVRKRKSQIIITHR